MVERICAQCQQANPLDNRFCGRCGTTLEPARLAAHPDNAATEHSQMVVSRAALPTEMKQVGKALAVSVAALAAEAGMTWLRRRVERMREAPAINQPATQHTQPAQRAMVQTQPTPVERVVTVTQQRVIQTWEHGMLTRQTIERTLWRREE